MSELYRYINENPQQSDTGTTQKTLAYLEACSKIFEKGLLSHSRITDMDSKVLQSINEGYTFFTSWLDHIIEKGIYWLHVYIYREREGERENWLLLLIAKLFRVCLL